MQNREDTQTVT